MLETLVILLASVLLFIPLSRRAGFGSVLGYLVAGALIGPAGLRLVTDVGQIRGISELGVVMLLFLIGLELRPQRLWVMRKAVFGLGPAQVLVTGAVLAVVVHLAGLSWPAATVIGAGLALSSTAIVLPMLGERDLLKTAAGRDAFAVLLLQDLAFIPMAALVPLVVGGGSGTPHNAVWLDLAKGTAGIAVLLLAGRYLVGPAFRLVGGARTPEVFNAMALFIVLGAAALANLVGLSMSLGAFLGGVMLSSSEYRHELQADIEPFEGLLLGFFFMSVGMSANLRLALAEPAAIALGVVGLLGVKVVVAWALGRLRGQSPATAVRFALAIPQGSEFAFVLFGAALAAGALLKAEVERATLVVALSMLASPILFAVSERFLVPRLDRKPTRPIDDLTDVAPAPVVILGFGRFGQIAGRILRARGVAFTALDSEADNVDAVRRFGYTAYFGDPTRLDLLRQVGMETAKVLVIALPDPEQTLKVAELARTHFPQAKVFARARNRRHAHLLMDIGVHDQVRETFFSALRLSELMLVGLGLSDTEARRTVQIFRERDVQNLMDSHEYYTDEKKLIQTSAEAAAELRGLFEADANR